MHDEDDLPEPEHDHLLDHDFLYEAQPLEADAEGMEDDIEDDDYSDDDLGDEEDHPAWHDDPND
ncbi:hypothetical protein [Pseudomonas sp. REB1044]|uniref:hypothetical protein n=1 Tax=Pseudomonas sp. REB1044 TaxID=2675224 RepID=UPI00315D5EAB